MTFRCPLRVGRILSLIAQILGLRDETRFVRLSNEQDILEFMLTVVFS